MSTFLRSENKSRYKPNPENTADVEAIPNINENMSKIFPWHLNVNCLDELHFTNIRKNFANFFLGFEFSRTSYQIAEKLFNMSFKILRSDPTTKHMDSIRVAPLMQMIHIFQHVLYNNNFMWSSPIFKYAVYTQGLSKQTIRIWVFLIYNVDWSR